MSHSGTGSPGRNDPCPCGSERRYKSCCGRLASVRRERQRTVNAQRGPAQAFELAQLMALLDGGRYAELESMAQQWLEAQSPAARHPPSAILWPLLGLARARQGKDALDAFSRAVQCAPEDAASHVNLGNALARLGRLEQAASHYGRALEIDPEFAEAHNNLGELYLELGRAQEALLSCQRALRIRPDFAPAHQNLATAQVRLGRFDEALLSCRRAIEINPRSPGAHNTLGSALAGLARFEDALASFGRALAIDPKFAQAHANLAHLLRGLGRLDEAVASYRRALKIEPNLIQAHTELATALRLQRRGEEAEECCREALRIDPGSAAALVVLAELRADAGLFIEAEALFRHASSRAPDLPEAWSGLARVRRLTSADETWLAATQALVERGTSPQGELLLRYALGKYFDDVGE